MKINKKSWHYRINSWVIGAPSKNLCDYFWQVVVSIFFCIVVVVLVCAAGFLAVNAIVAPLFYLIGYDGYLNWVNSSSTFPVYLGAFTVWFFSLVAGFVCLCIKWSSREVEVKHESKSLLGEYISAKKQKICPILEFED